jgi:hypothetical protein
LGSGAVVHTRKRGRNVNRNNHKKDVDMVFEDGEIYNDFDENYNTEGAGGVDSDDQIQEDDTIDKMVSSPGSYPNNLTP